MLQTGSVLCIETTGWDDDRLSWLMPTNKRRPVSPLKTIPGMTRWYILVHGDVLLFPGNARPTDQPTDSSAVTAQRPMPTVSVVLHDKCMHHLPGPGMLCCTGEVASFLNFASCFAFCICPAYSPAQTINQTGSKSGTDKTNPRRKLIFQRINPYLLYVN